MEAQENDSCLIKKCAALLVIVVVMLINAENDYKER